MARTPFTVAYDEDAGMLTLSGDLDDSGALELGEWLAGLTRQARDLVMDLSSVGSLPSTAVGVIAAARANMRAHFNRLELVAAQGSAAGRVLARSGMAVQPRKPSD